MMRYKIEWDSRADAVKSRVADEIECDYFKIEKGIYAFMRKYEGDVLSTTQDELIAAVNSDYVLMVTEASKGD